LVLQGNADTPPLRWWTRALRSTPGAVQAATTTAGVVNAKKKAVLAVIVRGCGDLQHEARRKLERRHRLTVMHTRLCMHKLLCTKVLAPGTLPIVLEVHRGDISARGALQRHITDRVREVLGEQEAGEQAGEGPPEPKRRKVEVKVSQRIKVGRD
jgi:hypothetical protein